MGLDVDGGVRVDKDQEDGVRGAGRRAGARARAGGRQGGVCRHGAGSNDRRRERGQLRSLGAARPKGSTARGVARPGAARPDGAVDVRAAQWRTRIRAAEGLRDGKLGPGLLIPCREVEIGETPHTLSEGDLSYI